MRHPIIIACIVLAPAGALAHTTPAVLGVAGDATDDLRVVRIAHGLTQRGDGDRFVCPSAWGGPERALAAGGIVFGVTEAYRITPEGAVRVGGFDGTPHAVARTEAGAWMLSGDGPTSRLYRVSASTIQRVHDWPDRFDGLATTDGAVFVAGGDGLGGLRIVRLDATGVVLEDRTVAADLDLEAVSLVGTATTVYVRANGSAGVRLGRVDDDRVFWIAAGSVLYGPSSIDGQLYVVQDGVLYVRAADDWSVVDDTRRYTCLDQSVVCTRTALYRLDDGGVGEAIYTLDAIEPPVFAAVDMDRRVGCRAEWLDFASEAELDPGPGPVEPVEDADGGCGCRAVSGTTTAITPWWLVLLVRRRKNR